MLNNYRIPGHSNQRETFRFNNDVHAKLYFYIYEVLAIKNNKECFCLSSIPSHSNSTENRWISGQKFTARLIYFHWQSFEYVWSLFSSGTSKYSPSIFLYFCTIHHNSVCLLIAHTWHRCKRNNSWYIYLLLGHFEQFFLYCLCKLLTTHVSLHTFTPFW